MHFFYLTIWRQKLKTCLPWECMFQPFPHTLLRVQPACIGLISSKGCTRSNPMQCAQAGQHVLQKCLQRWPKKFILCQRKFSSHLPSSFHVHQAWHLANPVLCSWILFNETSMVITHHAHLSKCQSRSKSAKDDMLWPSHFTDQVFHKTVVFRAKPNDICRCKCVFLIISFSGHNGVAFSMIVDYRCPPCRFQRKSNTFSFTS